MQKKQHIINGYHTQKNYSTTKKSSPATTYFIVTTIDTMTGKILNEKKMSVKQIHDEQTAKLQTYRLEKTIEKMVPKTYRRIFETNDLMVQKRLRELERIALIESRKKLVTL